MTKLTEEMVVARSKQSDLSSIKRLNCWGAELTDVSILKRMKNVEVLALSINKIKSLVDFQHCLRLKELYIRQNKIADIGELRHLRKLPALKILWLDENPCAEISNYRMTVLRNLPNLEKLDNRAVESDEVEDAAHKGAIINDSDAEDDYDPELENYNQQQQQQNQQQVWSKSDENSVAAAADKNNEKIDCTNTNKAGEAETSSSDTTTTTGTSQNYFNRRSSSPPNTTTTTTTTNTTPRNSQDYEETTAPYTNTYSRPSALPRSPPNANGSYMHTSPVRQQQRCYSPDNYEDPRYEQTPQRSQYFERSASLGDDLSGQQQAKDESTTENQGTNDSVAYRRMLHHSQSANSIKEYAPVNGDNSGHGRYQHQANNRYSVDMTPQHHSDNYERPDRYASQNLSSANNTSRQQQHQPSQQEQWERDSIVSASKERDGQIASAVMADHKGFTRRPMTRNSNLLSAVLCLVKELDYTSLEVAEMAVRCRMDELANRP